MNFIICIFQGFYLLFRNTYLKEHPCVAASVRFNREASQKRTYFVGKYYSRVLKCENTTFKTISRGVCIYWREYLFTSK